jgi:hypothetical protein
MAGGCPRHVIAGGLEQFGDGLLSPVQHTPPYCWIAVGTALAGGPPRRSQRALLTHWAPALGLGVEPLAWEGMHHAGGW